MLRPFALVAGLLLVLIACPPTLADEDAGALYAKAVAAEKARAFVEALALYEKVLEVDEEHEDVLDRYEACVELAAWRETVEGEITAQDLVRLGEVYAELRRPEQEEAVYEEAIEMDASCRDAHGHLALLHYAGRRFRGSLVTVVRETTTFLETSPHREHLDRAVADFGVYGELRILGFVLRDPIGKRQAAERAGKPLEAAKILEDAVELDVPDAYRTWLLVEAGKLRRKGEDADGARAAFEQALRHANCAETMRAHLHLALLELAAGDEDAALERLRAAVAEGSAASRTIAQHRPRDDNPQPPARRGTQREKAFAALFGSEDEVVRAEMERLADMKRADDPFRERIDAAVKRAAAEDKLVLLHFYGPYCPYVMAMEERLAHPEVREVLAKKFVHLRIDFGSHHRAITIDREYGDVFAEHGVPSFYVLDREGSIHSIQKDIPLMERGGRSFSVEKILDWLRSVE